MSAPPGTQIAAILPLPEASADLNTSKAESFTISAISKISKGILRSGLSEPNLVMASSQVMRGSTPRSTPATSCQSFLIMVSTISWSSAAVRNEVSISIWVNSGWRSARRSSSRKHFTI